MTKNLDARLERLLGGTELAALRLRLRRYFERQDSGVTEGALQLTKLKPAEHEALSLLTGRPPRSAQSVRIDIGELNAILKSSGIANSLLEALEMIDGPLVNRVAARADLQARWSRVTGTGLWHRALDSWLATPCAISLLRRLARQDPEAAQRLLDRANAVLQRLPALGLTRAQLAADALGNAHALDNGQATATLVLAALQHGQNSIAPRQETSLDGEQIIDAEIRPPAERMREIWARAGVLVNELARPALFLNLPTRPDSLFQAIAGEPGYLSLRQLLRSHIAWSVSERRIYVCENPNIVSIAADRLGAVCAPLVCTDGMPAAAQRVLLSQLANAGAKLRYHGDFDWPGLQIANKVIELCGARPWRFSSFDYEQAVTVAPHTERDLGHSVVTASWDTHLAAAMCLHGLAIAEEAVASLLLSDLAVAAGGS